MSRRSPCSRLRTEASQRRRRSASRSSRAKDYAAPRRARTGSHQRSRDGQHAEQRTWPNARFRSQRPGREHSVGVSSTGKRRNSYRTLAGVLQDWRGTGRTWTTRHQIQRPLRRLRSLFSCLKPAPYSRSIEAKPSSWPGAIMRPRKRFLAHDAPRPLESFEWFQRALK